MTAETLGGIALLLGIYPRIVALGLITILLGAIATVHAGAGLFFHTPHGCGEFPAFSAVTSIVQGLVSDRLYASKLTTIPGSVINPPMTQSCSPPGARNTAPVCTRVWRLHSASQEHK